LEVQPKNQTAFAHTGTEFLPIQITRIIQPEQGESIPANTPWHFRG